MKAPVDEMLVTEIAGRVAAGTDITDIDAYVRAGQAEPLFVDGKLVGCVKSAHDTDINLSAHVMHENIMSKASSVLRRPGPAGMPAAIRSRPFTASWLTRQQAFSAVSCSASARRAAKASACSGCRALQRAVRRWIVGSS